MHLQVNYYYGSRDITILHLCVSYFQQALEMVKKPKTGRVNVDHKDWFSYLVKSIDLVNFIAIFATQTILFRSLTFEIVSLVVILTILVLWIFPTLLS